MVNHLTTGEQGERMAADFLQHQGYTILEYRYRSKLGEIDIIATQGEWLIFVEVKTRKNTTFGYPSEAVHYRKQTKIIHTALQYLSYSGRHNSPMRFDVIEVLLIPGNHSINHIQNAFGR